MNKGYTESVPVAGSDGGVENAHGGVLAYSTEGVPYQGMGVPVEGFHGVAHRGHGFVEEKNEDR